MTVRTTRAARVWAARAARALAVAVARAGQRRQGDAGMTTAEYAIGTVAACGFGGILYKILTSPEVVQMLKDVFTRAFSQAF